MSVFQLPKMLCKDINSIMSKFWWGHKEDDSHIAWMNWSKLGRPKENGWFGFPRFGVVQHGFSREARVVITSKTGQSSFHDPQRKILSP